MLIIPIENKPEWSKPPIVTIGLILLNLLVFLFYQGSDNEIAEEAVKIYQQHKLLEFEREHFLAYSKQEYPELAQDLAKISNPAERDAYLMQGILFDRGFDHYLQQAWTNFRKMKPGPNTENCSRNNAIASAVLKAV
jgi:hypothetical protein